MYRDGTPGARHDASLTNYSLSLTSVSSQVIRQFFLLLGGLRARKRALALNPLGGEKTLLLQLWTYFVPERDCRAAMGPDLILLKPCVYAPFYRAL